MRRQLSVSLAAVACLLLCVPGCRTRPEPEPAGEEAEEGTGVVEGEKAPAEAKESSTSGSEPSSDEPPPDSPFPSMQGADGAPPIDALETRYTRDIPGDGPLFAILETTAGEIRCRLYEDKVPRTVDNFVGLARGLKPWRDPETGEKVERPFYQGLIFHRVVPDLLIQTGDPTGTGHGHPGYTFEDEFAEGLSHNQAGVMSMAQSQPHGNGSQFFITDGPALQFDGRYPIFGLCGNTDVVHEIATKETGDSRVDRPKEPVVLESVTFERGS